MGMSDFYGPADEVESLRTIDAALEAGITLLDTGDFYGMGHNELLVRQALQGRRERVFLQVKFGGMRMPSGQFIGMDCRPQAVKNFISYSLKRLNTDYIDLYQPARVDPNVPIEETAGAVADLIKAGYVRYFGLSEAAAATIRRAHAVHPVTALQIEYSLMSRGIEREILPAIRELGIGVTAYGVLSRGLLSGNWARSAGSDFRNHLPRYSGGNLARNMELVESLRAVAASHNATPAQVATAWVHAQGADIVPLVGARRRDQLAESLGALPLRLTEEDLARVEAAVPHESVAGDRYQAEQMAILDSERQ